MPTSSEQLALRKAITDTHRLPEVQLLPNLMALANCPATEYGTIQQRALDLIANVRNRHGNRPWIAELLNEYPLSTTEGLALMGMAECCLRVPDRYTRLLLIRDKLAQGQWRRSRSHRGQSWRVRASALGLQLGQYLLDDDSGAVGKWLTTATQPLVLRAIQTGMRMISDQFVYGSDIEAALQRAQRKDSSCSFDMLGEAARTAADAERYHQAYAKAITTVGQQLRAGRIARDEHSISIKLSALHPRYEALQANRAVPELVTRLTALAERAMAYNIGLTIDAEECDRLEMSLNIVEQLLQAPTLCDWQDLSVAVQAYQKRALPVINWLNVLARDHSRHIGVRLVKGAYWDMEIKRCQERGLSDFPVFTRKASTDVSYLACARELLVSKHLVPAFATHNALTVATLLSWISTTPRPERTIEFQRLHGMAPDMYATVQHEHGLHCRVYAPVGRHQELLPYLIRRMLENSSNSGFVHQLGNPAISAESLVQNPVQLLQQHGYDQHPSIQSPTRLFGNRKNSAGLDLADRATLDALSEQLRHLDQHLPLTIQTMASDAKPS